MTRHTEVSALHWKHLSALCAAPPHIVVNNLLYLIVTGCHLQIGSTISGVNLMRSFTCSVGSMSGETRLSAMAYGTWNYGRPLS